MDIQMNELQQCLKNVINEQNKVNEKLSQAYKNAIGDYLESLDLLSEIQETTHKVCADVFSANEAANQTFRDAVAQISKDIASSKGLQDSIRKCQITSFSEIVNVVPISIPTVSLINEAVPNCIESLKESSPDDFVTIDEPLIHEINIPDEMIVPIGNCRFKMSTGLFVSIIGFIVGLLLTFFTMIYMPTEEDVSFKIEEQNQIIIEQNQMLIDQTQILYDLLDSADASESSQADIINSWKESILITDN